METTETTRLDIFRTLADGLAALVSPTAHHRSYVRESIQANDLDALGELDGALMLARERGDTPAALVLSGLRGTIGHGGKFPPGCWAEIIAEHSYAYVNSYYCALAETERKGGPLDWSAFLN